MYNVESFGAVIIGAGIQGLSVAAHLIKQNYRDILILEKEPYNDGKLIVPTQNSATGRSAAMIMLQVQDAAEDRLKLMVASYQEYAHFQEIFNADVGFVKCGSVLFATNPESARKLENTIVVSKRLGIPVEQWDIATLKSKIPFINTEGIITATFCKLDGYVDQHDVCNAYKNYIQKYGKHNQRSILFDTKVTGIIQKNGKVVGVKTSRGELRADFVINAAGPFASDIGVMADLKYPIPVEPSRRTLWGTTSIKNAEAGGLYSIIEDIDSEYYLKPMSIDPNTHRQYRVGVGLKDFIIGKDVEDSINFRPENDDETNKYLAERYGFAAIKISEDGWSGIRDLTEPDELPILGPVDGLDGFINCCGWSGYGVMLAPIAGQLIAHYICKAIELGENGVAIKKEDLIYESQDISGKPLRLNIYDFRLVREKLQEMKVWKPERHKLIVGHTPVIDLMEYTPFGSLEKICTPLYLYDAGIVIDRVKRIKRAFPQFQIFYSVKSNPLMALIALMAQYGIGAEVVSQGEFSLVEGIEFPKNKIAITEPGKQTEIIRKYIGKGMIYVESIREIELVNTISKEIGEKTPIMVRINPLKNYEDAGENMGGASKFGVPEEDAIEVLNKCKCDNVEYVGIHVYTGSQVLDFDVLVEKFLGIARMSKKIANKVNFNLKQINFGGGFGVPYNENGEHLDIQKLGETISSLLEKEFPDTETRPVFQMELGRYLVAEAGIFLTRIVEVKSCRGTNFVITDSGINNFARPAMPWAQQHYCSIIDKIGQKPTGNYKVVGSLCQPSDVLCESIPLPNPQEGDYIAFFNVGAYGFTMSPQFYHSKVIPAEILFYKGQPHIVRQRIDDSSKLFKQLIPRQIKEQ